MTARTLRIWFLVHKWTSLITTVFLLLLCLTGLPLIFHEEIEHYFEPPPPLRPLTADTPPIDYDTVIASALVAQPGRSCVLSVSIRKVRSVRCTRQRALCRHRSRGIRSRSIHALASYFLRCRQTKGS